MPEVPTDAYEAPEDVRGDVAADARMVAAVVHAVAADVRKVDVDVREVNVDVREVNVDVRELLAGAREVGVDRAGVWSERAASRNALAASSAPAVAMTTSAAPASSANKARRKAAEPAIPGVACTPSGRIVARNSAVLASSVRIACRTTADVFSECEGGISIVALLEGLSGRAG